MSRLKPGVFMARERMIKIELLSEEQALLLEYGYPFEPESEQLKQLLATGDGKLDLL